MFISPERNPPRTHRVRKRGTVRGLPDEDCEGLELLGCFPVGPQGYRGAMMGLDLYHQWVIMGHRPFAYPVYTSGAT